MKKTLLYLYMLGATFLTSSCSNEVINKTEAISRYNFPNIVDIHMTPNTSPIDAGCFTDAGSWMGFTIPQKDKWINGFCGPFSIDNRIWFSQSIVEVNIANNKNEFIPDSTSYFPGEIYMKSSCPLGSIQQRMNFIDAQTALLHISSDKKRQFIFHNHGAADNLRLETKENKITFTHESGEIVELNFQPGITIEVKENTYTATTSKELTNAYVAISFYSSSQELAAKSPHVPSVLLDPTSQLRQNLDRWNNYLSYIIRDNMPYKYDRIAAKAIVTLISNWRTSRGALFHEGIIPSHAVNYFTGFWAWDSWRFSAALAQFFPELAKNNIRAMFDYQQPDGMIIDCVFTNPAKNNARDSKPPLVCWAVDEIFTHNNDTAFVKEMYPKLMSYYKWWYTKRDHDHNGMCEFGSTDGTREAAAWESGMDNAIRFDSAKMVRNCKDGWSMDQESVDLNAYLALECKLLKKFAQLSNTPFDGPDYSEKVANYFFNPKTNFFGDRRLKGRKFISDLGCEGYIPFWTKIASKEQMKKALPTLIDTAKFSTYIPFPTAAADNPKCNSDGYWRGPIWLDQTYFAIKGLRNYGYDELADKYTLQVFDRIEGLTGSAPIHENYGTHTGNCIRAPHFSWSAAHLLMMYRDYGK